MASVVNTFIAVGLGYAFLLFGLMRPSFLKSRVGFWTAAYFGIVILATSASPFVKEDNLLRVIGLLAASMSISFALIVGTRLISPLYALVLAARWYIPGILFTTLLLLAANPYVLAFQEVGKRFGDTELLHPNVLGMAYGLGLLFLFFLPVYPWRIAQYSLTFLLGIALLATFSKTAVGAVVVGVVVGWLLLRGMPKLVFGLVVAFGGTFLIFVIGDYVLSQLQAYLDNTRLALTLSGRTDLWNLVLEIVKERPILGFGFAVFKDVVGPLIGFSVAPVQAHNAYLDALFSGGYLGLTIFVLLVLRSAYLTVAAIRSLQGAPPAAFLAAVTFFLLVRSITEGALNLGFDFWAMLTAALAAERLVWLPRFKKVPR